jgi:hypothetical protein
MSSCSLRHCRRFVKVKTLVHAAPTELGGTYGVIVTINMALLTELGGPGQWVLRQERRFPNRLDLGLGRSSFAELKLPRTGGTNGRNGML